MDIQEKLADLLTWHVAVKNAFEEKKIESDELELQIKFITTITESRIEILQMRNEIAGLKERIEEMKLDNEMIGESEHDRES